ncbi:MAG: beta-lactamase family protein [Parvibaculaceae bacterium]|nr:beta-lactamase family protein [Parvibaculaceae bacterium]
MGDQTALSCWNGVCHRMVRQFYLLICLSVVGVPTIGHAADGVMLLPHNEGMLTWPVEEMVGALEAFVPRRLEELDVPGAAIAIVRDGQVVYEGTFGVRDVLSDDPVTRETLFEAASLSKPITAHGALMMVQDKTLSLSKPLAEGLAVPWLSQEHEAMAMTLRDVLSHRSGLGNNLVGPDRDPDDEPGSLFEYSGVGYMYLQHVMGLKAAGGFSEWFNEHVFGPLGMDKTGFSVSEEQSEFMARGYVPLYLPALLFFAPFLLLLSFSTIGVWAFQRFVLDRPRFQVRDLSIPIVLSIALTFFAVAHYVGWSALPYILLLTFCIAVFFLLVFSLLRYLADVMGLLRPDEGIISRGRRPSIARAITICLVVSAAATYSVSRIQVPLPHMDFEKVNAANSLRTTAGDLGLFVAGFLKGKLLSPVLYQEMFQGAAIIDDEMSWGLGLGIRQQEELITYWQWGSNPGFESILVIDPVRRGGVVVLTNSSHGQVLAQEIAGQVMGVPAGWDLSPNR